MNSSMSIRDISFWFHQCFNFYFLCIYHIKVKLLTVQWLRLECKLVLAGAVFKLSKCLQAGLPDIRTEARWLYGHPSLRGYSLRNWKHDSCFISSQFSVECGQNMIMSNTSCISNGTIFITYYLLTNYAVVASRLQIIVLYVREKKKNNTSCFL